MHVNLIQRLFYLFKKKNILLDKKVNYFLFWPSFRTGSTRQEQPDE